MIENLTSWQALAMIIVALLVFLIYQLCVIAKRPMRKAELRRLIEKIKDPAGDSDAFKTAEACKHLLKHYCIGFNEIGLEDYYGLIRLATDSFFRAERRGQEQMKKVRSHTSSFPMSLSTLNP